MPLGPGDYKHKLRHGSPRSQRLDTAPHQGKPAAYFGTNVPTNPAALSIQRPSAARVAQPAGATTTKPFIGLPVKSKIRA
jgi:hypothetical protein